MTEERQDPIGDDPEALVRAVAAALRYARWGGAEAVDRTWATPLSLDTHASAPPTDARVSARPQPAPPPAPRPAVEPAGPSLMRPGILVPPRPAASGPQRAQAATDPVAALEALRARIGDCQRCACAGTRSRIVHGIGSPTARLMLVAGAPGDLEDAAGLPCQGEAGQLLDRMLSAMGLQRADVWLTSLTLCRGATPGVPDPAAIAACSPFLRTQIETVRPEVILLFGEATARFLLRSQAAMPDLRSRWHTLLGVPTLATWPPDAVVDAAALKREVWADLQLVMAKLGLKRG